MNRHDFRNEYMRLANGHTKPGVVTNERLSAMYDRLGHYELKIMVIAVDNCLLDLSMPGFSRLSAALDHAQAMIDKRDLEYDRATMPELERGILPPISSPRLRPDEIAGLKAMRALYFHCWDEGISPTDCIPLMRELVRSWPWLAEEIPHLEAIGDRWRNAQGDAYAGETERLEH